jgi:hypothetical protein
MNTSAAKMSVALFGLLMFLVLMLKHSILSEIARRIAP